MFLYVCADFLCGCVVGCGGWDFFLCLCWIWFCAFVVVVIMVGGWLVDIGGGCVCLLLCVGCVGGGFVVVFICCFFAVVFCLYVGGVCGI